MKDVVCVSESALDGAPVPGLVVASRESSVFAVAVVSLPGLLITLSLTPPLLAIDIDGSDDG